MTPEAGRAAAERHSLPGYHITQLAIQRNTRPALQAAADRRRFPNADATDCSRIRPIEISAALLHHGSVA